MEALGASELNDEIVAIGESIVDQFAAEVGPDKANEAFHEWNDVVYDICCEAHKRDSEGKVGAPSALRDPMGFLYHADTTGAISREDTIRDIVHRLVKTWRRYQQNPGSMMGYRDQSFPLRVHFSPHVQYGTGTYPSAMTGDKFSEFTANVPTAIHDERTARFLLEAQVREAVAQQER